MDEPIFYGVCVNGKEEPLDLKEKIQYALARDNKDEFLNLIRGPGFEEVRDWFHPDTVFEYEAVNCATALFNGEAEGFIDFEHVLEAGMTPLHLAALVGSSKITSFLIEKGYSVNDKCDYAELKLKQATPLDIAVNIVESNGLFSMWTPKKSIFELLCMLCGFGKRYNIETVRLLIQNTHDEDDVRHAFVNYAQQGKLVQLGVLFMAAQDLLFPTVLSLKDGWTSPSVLHKVFNLKETQIQEGVMLLLDAFAMMGEKLATYIRLDLPELAGYHGTAQEVAFLLREAVRHNQGGHSLDDDYLLRFFKPVLSQVWQREYNNLLEVEEDGYRGWVDTSLLSFDLLRKGIDLEYINRVIPDLRPENADYLKKAIKDKLSSCATLRSLQEVQGMSNKRVVTATQQFRPVRDARAAVGTRSFSTPAADQVMQLSRFKSLLSTMNVPSIISLAKRLIK